MTDVVSGTLDANAEEVGPIWVERSATVIAVSTNTITVTPHVCHERAGSYAPLTGSAMTASGGVQVNGPCWVKAVASAVSGGGTSLVSIRALKVGV